MSKGRKEVDVEKHTGKKMVVFESNGLSKHLGKKGTPHRIREDVAQLFTDKGHGKVKN